MSELRKNIAHALFEAIQFQHPERNKDSLSGAIEKLINDASSDTIEIIVTVQGVERSKLPKVDLDSISEFANRDTHTLLAVRVLVDGKLLDGSEPFPEAGHDFVLAQGSKDTP